MAKSSIKVVLNVLGSSKVDLVGGSCGRSFGAFYGVFGAGEGAFGVVKTEEVEGRCGEVRKGDRARGRTDGGKGRGLRSLCRCVMSMEGLHCSLQDARTYVHSCGERALTDGEIRR